MSKRSTDHLIPAAKKRSGDRQISREEPPSDSDDGEPQLDGDFKRADESTLKARRIFKARRGAGGVPASAPAAASGDRAAGDGGGGSANPFAGIALTPANSAGSNPFAGISLVPPAQPAKAEQPEQAQAAARGAEKEAGEPEQSSAAPPKGGEASAGPSGADKKEPAPGAKEADDTGAAAAAAAAQAPKADTQESGAKDAPAEAAKIGEGGSSASSPSAFASFASTKASGFAGLGGGSSNGLGFGAGGLGGAFGNGSTLGSAEFASSFGSAAPAASTPAPASTAFSFNTGGAATNFSFPAAAAPASSFPSVHNIFAGTPPSSAAVFGSGSGETSRPAPLPLADDDAARVTGEEEERTVFAGEGVLFEFDDAHQWRERGRGEMRVNVANKSGQARLVMRSRGQLRLLMNANLWPDMKITAMDGGKGVTFACINAAAVPGEEGAAQQGGDAGKGADQKAGGKDAAASAASGKLGTFAFRVKAPGKLPEFRAAVEAHRAAAGAEGNV